MELLRVILSYVHNINQKGNIDDNLIAFYVRINRQSFYYQYFFRFFLNFNKRILMFILFRSIARIILHVKERTREKQKFIGLIDF